jgi:hypothetical protein
MNREIGSRIVLGSLLLCAVSVASCKFESQAIPATQLVVDIDAEPGVRSRLDSLQVFIAGARHRDNLDEREKTWEETLQPGADPESPEWPIRIVLTPKADDARRVFELSATALDLVGAQVAQARVMTGYVQHQIRYVKLVIEDDCIGVSCDELDTCKVGGCTPAFIEPTDLPLLPGRQDAGVVDAGDAAPPVDTGVDAGPDAGNDAGMDSGMDSGPPEDPCTRVDHGGCDPLVVCQTIDGVPTCGQCPNGYVDVNGNGSRCEDIDECKLPDKGGCDTQHGKCTNTPGDHDCSCDAGYNGDGRKCTVNVQCGSDPTVCDSLATCQQIGDQRVCQCKTGFEGDGARCTNVDECMRNLDDCPVHAACADTEGSFTCTCDAGYAKPVGGANLCNDIDECLANTDNCDDMPNACRNTDGGFMCACPAGYSGSGVGDTCVDINECMLNTDGCDTNPDACINDIGAFHCMCPAGYSGTGVGNTCVNIDQCTMNLDDCAATPATCVDDSGSPGYHCTCPATGYTGTGTVASPCVDVNECSSGSLNNCNANATCTNVPAGSFTCTCNTGWAPTGTNPGHGAGGCINVNECTANTDDCNPNAACMDTQGSFTCTCNAGYTPAGGNPGHGAGGCTETNECTANTDDCNANAACTNTPAGSFTCACNAGFTPGGANPGHGTDGCADTNECTNATANCNAAATCTNTPAGDYTCTCGAGYSPSGSPPGRGAGGCVDINGCSPSPCLNGGSCADVVAPGTGATCTCACGYTGATCETAPVESNVGLTSGPDPAALDMGVAYAQPITIAAPSHLVAFGIAGAVGVGNITMALYGDTGASPGTRLAISGASPVGTSRLPVAGCIAVPAGAYWVAVLADSAGVLMSSSGINPLRYKGADLGTTFGGPTPDPTGNNLALFAITVP